MNREETRRQVRLAAISVILIRNALGKQLSVVSLEDESEILADRIYKFVMRGSVDA